MAAKKRTAGRPPKAAEVKKSLFLRVRLSEAHDAEIKEAAERVGLSVSGWVTERLLAAARREKAEASKK